MAYKVINYKDVLLFHLVHECNQMENYSHESVVNNFIEIVCQNGSSNPEREEWINRFDNKKDTEFILNLKVFLNTNTIVFQNEKELFVKNELNANFQDSSNLEELHEFFFNDFAIFTKAFYKIVNDYDIVKRTRLTHDLANNLRAYGKVKNGNVHSLEFIYTIAETINRLIKAWRKKKSFTKIVIDSLKNSLELMYFKEKYSAFYMVTTNKTASHRKISVFNTVLNVTDIVSKSEEEKTKITGEILNLDDEEYKTNDHKNGKFFTPYIENCIQKSDFHVFISEDAFTEGSLNVDWQLIRLVALISQPGIVTPTAIERSMQVAYNAKFNSGCISRQVGAVVTDNNFSVKSIGWNDVPQGQTPCNLRNITDLMENKTESLFSEYEKSERFKSESVTKLPRDYEKDLSGRNCSFCFKSFQNAIEGEKNQVHTRSLHAEENAMLQISKYGGQGLKDGNLFTTASPCELCSKKAFQLGIKNIYYIDPYPGISIDHILKSGHDSKSNPNLVAFQGAVGRVYHKLYEPFMAYKDELSLLTGINPKPSMDMKIRNLIKDKELQEKLIKRLEGKSELQKEEFLVKSLGISLEKTY